MGPVTLGLRINSPIFGENGVFTTSVGSGGLPSSYNFSSSSRCLISNSSSGCLCRLELHTWFPTLTGDDRKSKLPRFEVDFECEYVPRHFKKSWYGYSRCVVSLFSRDQECNRAVIVHHLGVFGVYCFEFLPCSQFNSPREFVRTVGRAYSLKGLRTVVDRANDAIYAVARIR